MKKFTDLGDAEKRHILAKSLFPKNFYENVVKERRKITVANMENLCEGDSFKIADSLADSKVKVDLLMKDYFEAAAFTILEDLINEKKEEENCTCAKCKQLLRTRASVGCDRCLL